MTTREQVLFLGAGMFMTLSMVMTVRRATQHFTELMRHLASVMRAHQTIQTTHRTRMPRLAEEERRGTWVMTQGAMGGRNCDAIPLATDEPQ